LLEGLAKTKNNDNNANLCRDLAVFWRRAPQYCRRRLQISVMSRVIRPRLEGFRP